LNRILHRIGREAGVPEIAKILADKIPPTDLQSLLLETYKQIAQRRRPSDLLSEYRRNSFTRPSKLDSEVLARWDRAAFDHLPENFELIELSPVSPLGSVSAIAPVSQDWVLTTIRHTELVSDPTNALALECAFRRQELIRTNPKITAKIHLACSHRVLRTQRYPNPQALQHFRLFSLCSAGRDTGSFNFENESLTQHLQFYLKLLKDYVGPNARTRVTLDNMSQNFGFTKALSSVTENILLEFPGTTLVQVDSKKVRTGYYQQFRFHIYVSQNEHWVELVDGGDTDWTRKLLNNQKERLITSAIGSDRACDMAKTNLAST